ncbi:thioredoxin family protein [Xenophilus sp. Marseille-Q4582]|uniref:thioredoxin family protein n=1 Tax=Xenophilus sp. Marseille-Q4582 TaxID=2866600 RepID=UPI001CE41C36|nr:thioredoxin family protein [Xenophilus sp. Marseille-Q4582]
MTTPYATDHPKRDEVDAQPGLTVLEFGANWCGICKAAQPVIAEALAEAPAGLRHMKLEDGSGIPLGRSFGVKLWPTLIFLRDGQEVARVVRPTRADDVRAPLAQLAG